MRQASGMMPVDLRVKPAKLIRQVIAAEAPPVEIGGVVGPAGGAGVIGRLDGGEAGVRRYQERFQFPTVPYFRSSQRA